MLPVGDSGAAAAGAGFRRRVRSLRAPRIHDSPIALPHRARHRIVAQMVGDDGVEAADGGKSGRQGQGGARAPRDAPRGPGPGRAGRVRSCPRARQVRDKRHGHAMGDELAAERLGVARELASRREHRLIRGRIRHLELLVQPGRVAGQHPRGLADRLKPSQQRLASQGFPVCACRDGRGHIGAARRVCTRTLEPEKTQNMEEKCAQPKKIQKDERVDGITPGQSQKMKEIDGTTRKNPKNGRGGPYKRKKSKNDGQAS